MSGYRQNFRPAVSIITRQYYYRRRHPSFATPRHRALTLFIIVAYSMHCPWRFVRRRGCPRGAERYWRQMTLQQMRGRETTLPTRKPSPVGY